MTILPPIPEPPTPPKPPELQAIGTIKDALAYVEAARILDKAREDHHHRYSPPIYFLLSHAIELVLKAYLLSQGTVPKELKRAAVRHNLKKLLEMAQATGFHPTDRFIETVAWLGPHHEDHLFRYRKTGYIRLPLPRQVAEIVLMEGSFVERIVRTRFTEMQDPPPVPGTGETT